MTDELKAEREAFERALKGMGWTNLPRDEEDGQYENSSFELAWELWQARAKLDRTHTTGGDVVVDIMAELEKAITKFPTWPTDPLHAVGVLNEEVGELSKSVLQQVYEPHKNNPGDIRKEALQAAAMAIRFIASINKYEWVQGVQHKQEILV